MILQHSKTFLEKFSDIIDRTPIGAAVEKRRQLINSTDPRRIYPENIRSFFHIPLALAKLACELAVREGLFEKVTGFYCPNEDCQTLLAAVPEGEFPEPMLHCEQCELLDRQRHSYRPGECRQIVFYRLAQSRTRQNSSDGSRES
jgi:hypothetical protein